MTRALFGGAKFSEVERDTIVTALILYSALRGEPELRTVVRKAEVGRRLLPHWDQVNTLAANIEKL